ncbi:MAG TPA: DUF935 family protein, partial [Candidatus Limnocylindria bacterium]|nr:DUF935 family protein [Candidatus Limnocylindria bacterium]
FRRVTGRGEAVQARNAEREAGSEAKALPVIQAKQPAPEALPPALMRIIRPEARSMWLTSSARYYTPDYIEMVLRAGMAGDLQQQWQLFDWMEQTWPRLLKNLGELKRAVAMMERSLVPYAKRGAKPTASAQAKADLIQDILFELMPEPGADENDFAGTAFDALDAYAKGISVLEVEYRTAEDGIVPRTTRWIHPTYYGFAAESNRLGLRAQTGVELPADAEQIGNGLYAFPPDKFLVATHKARSGILPGTALLRTLTFWWAASNFTAEWLLNFAQIFGMPIRWAEYDPSNASLLPLIEEMLRRMGSAGRHQAGAEGIGEVRGRQSPGVRPGPGRPPV